MQNCRISCKTVGLVAELQNFLQDSLADFMSSVNSAVAALMAVVGGTRLTRPTHAVRVFAEPTTCQPTLHKQQYLAGEAHIIFYATSYY